VFEIEAKKRGTAVYREIGTSKRSRCKCWNSWIYQNVHVMYVLEIHPETSE
jgi:hypothetical protein